MKRSFSPAAALALGATLILGSAQAADLSGPLWKYIQGKAAQQPMLDHGEDDTYLRIWSQPAGLSAEMAMFIYMPKESTNHWLMILADPKLPSTDYLGTRSVRKVETQTDAESSINVWKVEGGQFRGLFMLDGWIKADDGQRIRMFALTTPQVMAEGDDGAELLRKAQ
ncbi:hypothetical protein ACFP81_01445 [Deinococcus lacus]|uniref:DUF1254 domain-containing protein n=1 Tax=Deinococcus lacus TaxID=392561 RepID=A0ABW1Y9F4_9DEIO